MEGLLSARPTLSSLHLNMGFKSPSQEIVLTFNMDSRRYYLHRIRLSPKILIHKKIAYARKPNIFFQKAGTFWQPSKTWISWSGFQVSKVDLFLKSKYWQTLKQQFHLLIIAHLYLIVSEIIIKFNLKSIFGIQKKAWQYIRRIIINQIVSGFT